MATDDIKCVWPKTEANHDFGTHKLFTPSSLNDSNSFFTKVLYTDVGECGEVSKSDIGRNRELINDEDIVKKIFGKTKEYFRDLSNSNWSTLNVKCKSDTDGKDESESIKFLKIKKKDNSKEYDKLLTRDINIFENCNMATDASKVDVFFIQDVADAELLRQLKHTYNEDPTVAEDLPKKYYIHVINSVETIGDSASKILPDCKKMYCYKNKPHSTCKTRLFSWLNTNNRTLNHNEVHEYHEFMKTSYDITTYYDQNSYIKKRLIINQNWTKLGAGEFYPDINQANNRTSIIDEVKNHLNEPDDNQEKKEKISRAFQRKRSGDYLQIYFAKKFPYLKDEEFKLILPDQKQLDILKSQESQSESLPNEWQYPHAYQDNLIKVDQVNKKRNTFIVTNDWPCLAYAIYNKVNVILHNNSPSCRYLLVFQFTT